MRENKLDITHIISPPPDWADVEVMKMLQASSGYPHPKAVSQLLREAFQKGVLTERDEIGRHVREMQSAMEALTDPEGHIWHGGDGECTGECKDIREAIMKAKELFPPEIPL